MLQTTTVEAAARQPVNPAHPRSAQTAAAALNLLSRSIMTPPTQHIKHRTRYLPLLSIPPWSHVAICGMAFDPLRITSPAPLLKRWRLMTLLPIPASYNRCHPHLALFCSNSSSRFSRAVQNGMPTHKLRA
jgi:hypothetical protein